MAKQKQKRTQNKYLNKVIDFFNILANASSMGILFQAVARWIPAIRSLPFITGFLSTIIVLSDPLIYCFRSGVRIIRLVGRQFNLEFEEERHGLHPWQTQGDLLVLALCGLAITTFFGALIPPPFNLAAAWVFGIAAVSVICYFDYIWPEKKTREKLVAITNDPDTDAILAKLSNYRIHVLGNNNEKKPDEIGVKLVNGFIAYTIITPSGDIAQDVLTNIKIEGELTAQVILEKDQAIRLAVASTVAAHIIKKEHDYINYSKKMYIATIVSLVLLLIFGHAIALPFIPTILHVGLDWISKAGSLLLGCVNLARFANWAHPSGFSEGMNAASKVRARCLQSTTGIATGLNARPMPVSDNMPGASADSQPSGGAPTQSNTLTLGTPDPLGRGLDLDISKKKL